MDWSTKDFLKEIDDVAQLYALSSCSSMATSMIASLGQTLSTVSLRAADYVSLMQHVDGSNLPEAKWLVRMASKVWLTSWSKTSRACAMFQRTLIYANRPLIPVVQPKTSDVGHTPSRFCNNQLA